MYVCVYVFMSVVYMCMYVCVWRKRKIDYMCYTYCLFSLHAQLILFNFISTFFFKFSLFFLTFPFPLFATSFYCLFPSFYFSFSLFLSFIHSFYLILNKAMDLTSLSAYKLNNSFVCS